MQHVSFSTTCVPQKIQVALQIQSHPLKIEILALKFWYVLATKIRGPSQCDTKRKLVMRMRALAFANFMFKTARAVLSILYICSSNWQWRTNTGLMLFDAM